MVAHCVYMYNRKLTAFQNDRSFQIGHGQYPIVKNAYASLIGFIEPLVVAPRCKQSDSVARTAASSVFDVQVKRAHDVPLIRNLTNSSEAADARFDSGPNTRRVFRQAAITIRLGELMKSFGGRVSARL